MHEEALTGVGLWIPVASQVWEAYRKFELKYLEKMKEIHTDENPQDIQKQQMRISALFRRELGNKHSFSDNFHADHARATILHPSALPLKGMEETQKAYEAWVTSQGLPKEREIDSLIKKAKAAMSERRAFEDRVAAKAGADSAPKTLEAWRAYIAFELKQKNAEPARVQCLYERALVPFFNYADLWEEYIGYAKAPRATMRSDSNTPPFAGTRA